MLAGAAARLSAPRPRPGQPDLPAQSELVDQAQMRFTVQTINGHRVLLAEGQIDSNLIPRLQAALQDNTIEEIWLRSPGGDARVGNQAGGIIRRARCPPAFRRAGPASRPAISSSWAAPARIVDPGGLFIVHMFTLTSDREAIEAKHRGQRRHGRPDRRGRAGSALLASEDNDFLIRMGLHRAAADRHHVSPERGRRGPNRSTRRCLTQEELLATMW